MLIGPPAPPTVPPTSSSSPLSTPQLHDQSLLISLSLTCWIMLRYICSRSASGGFESARKNPPGRFRAADAIGVSTFHLIWLSFILLQFAITTCTPNVRTGRCPTAVKPLLTRRAADWKTPPPSTTGGRATCPPEPNVSSAASRAGVANAWPDGSANGVVWR